MAIAMRAKQTKVSETLQNNSNLSAHWKVFGSYRMPAPGWRPGVFEGSPLVC
jgi:hypothetical protein